MARKELGTDELLTSTDPSVLPFSSTDEVSDQHHIIGQDRAIEAIEFGIEIDKPGFNLFALGPAGVGKESTVLQYLERKSKLEDTPSDWCYVNNFEDPRKPHAIELPAGIGREFHDDVKKLVADMKTSIPVAFESDEYIAKLEEINERYQDRRDQALQALIDEAEAHDVTIVRRGRGFIVAPLIKGEIVSNKEFDKMPESEQKRLREITEIYEEKFSSLMHQMPQVARDEQKEIAALNYRTADMTVEALIEPHRSKYSKQPRVIEYFEAVKNDVCHHIEDFLRSGEQAESLLGVSLGQPNPLRRFEVNLAIDNGDCKGAPIVYLDFPVYPKLIGTIEQESRFGAIHTDFTLIKPGALLCANGGYVVLDAIRLLQQPFSYEALKRALFAKEVQVQMMGSLVGLVDITTLEPEPIPINLKVVLLGDRMLYYMLQAYDPDFSELFKVAADFEEEMDRSDDNIRLYAVMIAGLVKKEKLQVFDAGAVARVIDYSSRVAADAEKLTTHMLNVADLMREAEYQAKSRQSAQVQAQDVDAAIDAQIRRADRISRKILEDTRRGTLLIDTDDARTGVVNGLSVMQIGNFMFGHPVRISATTRIGNGKIIDIEREVEMAGSIHSKGVLILSSFLASRYTRDIPLSLAASLTFEQSYGFVEGDSASTAELCAILSSLAELPIQQGIAITGSVNQLGQVQVIGGVNEKIEGFFDLCVARGLTGKQGAIIPGSNVKHLMLKKEVVEAVSQGQFRIYAVDTVDDAVSILTGVDAGVADEAGKYPDGSVNALVEARLHRLSELRRDFSSRDKDQK